MNTVLIDLCDNIGKSNKKLIKILKEKVCKVQVKIKQIFEEILS